jgi:hypothetical protein
VLSRPIASLFSSVPSLSLLLTTHMLVLIAVRRGEEHDRASAPDPAPLAVVTPHRAPSVKAQITATDGGSSTGAHAAIEAPPKGNETAVPETADPFASWVEAQHRAGVRPTGRMVAEAGFAGSEATGRRWLRNLRVQTTQTEEARS